LLFAGEAAGAGVEPGLQNEDGCNLIDDALATDGCVASVVEMAMGLGGGEPLVPEVDCDSELSANLFCKSLGLSGLRALISRHIKRVANYRLGDGVLAEDAGDGLHVGSAVGAVQGEERLRGEAEGIGESDADAAVAYVEAYDALR
jgi:hypothetical protein